MGVSARDAGKADRATAIELWCVDLGRGAETLIACAQRAGLIGADTIDATQAPDAVLRSRTAARSALRLILAGHVGLALAARPFVVAKGGKPSIAATAGGARVEHSLAHSDRAALIAISRDGPVGVDIEEPRSVRLSDHRRAMLIEAARALSPSQPLPEGPGEAQFLQAWVRLEALAKATGEGLGALLGRLHDRAMPPHATQHADVPVRVRDIDLGGGPRWAAVAGTSGVLGTDAKPVARWLPADRAWLDDWLLRAAAGATDPERS